MNWNWKNNTDFLAAVRDWLNSLDGSGVSEGKAQEDWNLLRYYGNAASPPLPFFQLWNRLGLGDREALLLLCALIAEFAGTSMTFMEAYQILAAIFPKDCDVLCLPEGEGLFSLLWRPWEGFPLGARPLSLRRGIVVFLIRGYFEAELLPPPVRFCPQVHANEYAMICEAAEEGKPILLTGPPGAGKHTLAARYCAAWGGGILVEMIGDPVPEVLENMLLAAVVTNRPLCICVESSSAALRAGWLHRLAGISLLFLSSDETVNRLCGLRHVSVPELLLPEERAEACLFYGISVPTGLRLSIAELSRASSTGHVPSSRELLLSRWGGRSFNGLAELCEVPAQPWYVPGEKMKERLDILCSFLKNRLYLLDDMGFSELHPGGRSILSLFHGSSGTGKTFTACAVARELGLPLLRVDLSNVLDKYLGETEKHLDEVFRISERLGCLLLFDEADALFARRTAVDSSHDRYANLSTSYLLQRLESFDGAAILSTNLLTSFDHAFLRRIQFVIRFSLPGPQERRQLWERAFPSNIVFSQEVDFSVLAEKELSPAQISNAAILAAALALRNGGVVFQEDLVEAVRIETEKRG